MRIFINLLGSDKKLALDVEPTDTVESLKLTIARSGADLPPMHMQRLIAAGVELEASTRSLQSYGVAKDSIIHLVLRLPPASAKAGTPQISVTVRMLTGTTIPLQVAREETVHDVKLKVQAREGLRPDQQRLICRGRQLLDDSQTVAEIGVGDGDIINLAPPLAAAAAASSPTSTSAAASGGAAAMNEHDETLAEENKRLRRDVERLIRENIELKQQVDALKKQLF